MNYYSEDQLDIFQKNIILICSTSSEEFWLNFNLENIDSNRYFNICDKIKKHFLEKQPVSYLTKKCFFNGNSFEIQPGVFIPQHDTEILVSKTLELISEIWTCDDKLDILEIGTGSGNISISLAKNNNIWKIKSLDINKKALSVARNNARNLNVDNIIFFKSDVFSNVQGKFDVIISNPPYIGIEEYNHLDSYTKAQPKEALVADNNGYWFYQEIAEKSRFFLKDKFLLIFEIGYKQQDEIIKIVLTCFSDIKVKNFYDNSFQSRVVAFYRF